MQSIFSKNVSNLIRIKTNQIKIHKKAAVNQISYFDIYEAVLILKDPSFGYRRIWMKSNNSQIKNNEVSCFSLVWTSVLVVWVLLMCAVFRVHKVST